tara:strand:- start:6232 stop:7287 length:1056 start_codon:yes stop_codon:yes gene_type:complete
MKNIYFIIILLFSSCGLLSESSKPTEYNSSLFSNFEISDPPNYELYKSWAVHPKIDSNIFSELKSKDKKLPVDIFFIYPTMLSDKNDVSWNANIYDTKTRNYILDSTIKYQSSAWYSTGNVYVPFYRQAHLRVFRESFWKNGGEQAYEMAYQDIKKAFEIFLKKYNKNRPIIIAGHSQGAGHAKRILQDFFDNKPLEKKLIAAYLIGTKITDKDFSSIKLMTNKNETGGFVTWNTYRLMSKRKTEKAVFTVNPEWIEGALCTNPVTWDSSKTSNYDDHKGFLYLNNKIYPKTVKIEDMDSKIYIRLPKMGILKKLLVSSVKDYHKADINLFWEDIRINSINRSKSYLSKIN